MTAKQIVNRLLEDYDPDLAEISPEEVAAESEKNKGFELWYGDGSWLDGGTWAREHEGSYSFVWLCPGVGENDDRVDISTTYGTMPESTSELESWLNGLDMSEEEDELALMSPLQKMVSAFEQNVSEFSRSTCTKEEFEEEYGVKPV